MTENCRLTTAEHFDVALSGATIKVTVQGVLLEVDEVARIIVITEGSETRCRLQACKVVASVGSASNHEKSFALAFPPDVVVIEHSSGAETFRFGEQPAVPPYAEPPMRGEPSRNYPPDLPPAEDADVDGPVLFEPQRAPADVVRRQGDQMGDLAYGGGQYGDDGGGIDDQQQPQRGRIILPAPSPPSRPGGWISGTWDRLRGRLSTRSGSRALPQNLDEGVERRPMAARSGDEPEPTPAMPAQDRGPTAAMADDEPMPTLAREADGDGGEQPAPQGGRFPRLDAPEFFEVGKATDIVVGVRPDEDIHVGGGPMALPPTVGETYVLWVQVIADGFDLGGNTTSWVHDLAVTAQQPYPFVEMTIVAKPIDVPAKAAVINVIYTVEDQVIGNGKRAVAIGTQRSEAEKIDLPDVAVRRAMALPVGATPADLTVVILTDETGPGDRLLWAFRTPHDVEVPKHDCITEIGKRPEDFAETLRGSAERAEGKPLLLKTMRGIGRTIAGAMHGEFWRVFQEIQDRIESNPTVLFLSEEPYVPWELAVLPKPLSAGNDKFLAAEAVTGRWLLIEGPQMPPPEQLAMKSMAVVYGEYADSRLNELKEAKAEMESLQTDFQATPVRATQAALNQLLDGAPSAEVLHFAIHGKFKGEGADLLMEDGSALGPFTIQGSNLANAPFVFLNACQVGAANELLGSFAGMAQAFLSAGASAVVAPLWSVRDDIAKEISLRFYPLAFGGEAPAEVLRRERASFAAVDPPISATYLAYQFYGHPGFRLTK